MIRIEKIVDGEDCCNSCQKPVQKDTIYKISTGKPDVKNVLRQAIAIRLCGDCINELKYQFELGGLWDVGN